MPARAVKYATAALVGAAFLGSAPAAATGLSVRGLAAHDLRLATAAYRIGAANARACAQPEMMTGMVLHDLTQYRPAARPAVSQAFQLKSGFGILGVVPGSVAHAAGLHVDDEIIAVGNSSVEDPLAITRNGQSYQRVERASLLLQGALARGTTSLTVRRRGRLIRAELRGQPGCGGRAALTESSSLNAWSDGRRVVLSTAMTSLAASDDELAFVVAHEMAHNILGHFSGGKGSRSLLGGLGLGFSRIRRGEIEADAYAVRLMSEAGYGGQGATLVLEKMRRRMWWAASLDHPGFGRRIRIVTTAMASIRANRTVGTIAADYAMIKTPSAVGPTRVIAGAFNPQPPSAAAPLPKLAELSRAAAGSNPWKKTAVGAQP